MRVSRSYEPSHVDRDIGVRIRAARTAQGLLQPQLAALVGSSYQMVQKYELGHSRIAVSTVVEYAQALNVPVGQLLGEIIATAGDNDASP